MSALSANVRSDRHRPPPIATANSSASADAPLRVYDRFAAAAIDTGLAPPTAASNSNSRNNRGSVFGAWSNSASGHATNASPASPPAQKDGKAAANASDAVDDAKEEVLSISAVSAKGHRREESELTGTPYLTSSPLEPAPFNPPTSLPSVAAGAAPHAPRRDKASQVLGIPHRSSMEPIPGRKRTSIMSTRSAQNPPPSPSFTPTMPLASLYVVSGLPKRPQTWTLADPDAVQGLTHSDGAVGRWWRAEVLGSTVSPGVGGGKKKKVTKGHTSQTEMSKGPGALSKQETAKMLSKALKLSFTREVEIIASTLQPASTVHTFTFTLPAPNTPLAPPSTIGLSALRNSVLTTSTDNNRFSNALSSYGTFPYSYADTHARPSSAYLGPSSVSALDTNVAPKTSPDLGGAGTEARGAGSITYHGVCLTVWSHADAERTGAIRRALESVRSRKESAQSIVASRIKALRSDIPLSDPAQQARRSVRSARRGPWSVADGETDGESEGEAAISESDFEVASTTHGPGESTLFLTGDTVFWLPYALTLVSRHPIYDLMRDYLTLSWARFSKDVASHTLQISKILSHPAPRAGDIVRLDASPKEGGDKGDGSLEVVARFPGGLDFGRGLVDINFTMWPLFKCLNIDNILSICEIALAPTGRILFFSRHPAMLGIAVATVKYLVELRGWNGIALPSVHARDARIYIEDPGPWIIGLAAEMRYAVRPPPEVCICDLDINYLSCASPPPDCLSAKQQRDKYRQRLLAAFGELYHPDHSVPIELKEAFPAGRFRPICKIQAKRGASSSVVAESIKAPEWWNSTRIIQAFDSVLQERFRKPSLFKRISSFGSYKRPPRLSGAEQQVQRSIRKRATAFVDARDDLETKIGRLSRRLNFLMTESDLWREKFVTFEQYAEKLSTEASDLRAKISKEQRESKRLTGLVSLTAAEKLKLQSQLHETETAHKDALTELERMRDAMERMEEERAQLVEEVEAQIERALASMSLAVEMGDSDAESQVGSHRSVSSRPSTGVGSRRSSNASHSNSIPPRPFSTDSTLAGTAETDEETRHSMDSSTFGENATSPTVVDNEHSRPSTVDRSSDMVAVDESIHQNTDRIAQKVMQIQQKLENAMSERRFNRPSLDSENESKGSRPISPATLRHTAGSGALENRTRSNTVSSTQTSIRTRKTMQNSPTTKRERSLTPKAPSSPYSKAVISSEDPVPGIRAISPATLSPTAASRFQSSTITVTSNTEDSDTDFQSAYSTSPRESYYDSGSGADADDHDKLIPIEHHDASATFGLSNGARDRASSAATAIAKIQNGRVST